MAKRDETEITKRFTPKQPNQPDLVRLASLQFAAIEFGLSIRALCPDNSMRMRAEEAIEVGVMLAAKSITHNITAGN
jgi:hypothetical protein